ncbi:unnamed protein product [Prunus armeniaca]|uniref:Wall-associated receptor kinase galacturonan-binding domain-containing protein n=1 Tax=Prunus armeniaca TaxID=36596 RepID=A0A6J5UTR9_PRUAR|nr:unnamed protein product [Prunus armeniaca]
MSHSGASLSAMQVMIVVMVMALLTTTSHCINISGSYSSSSRCNGLTGTACRIAYSELDFDLEFMLDSEFSIRILKDGDPKITFAGLEKGSVSCGPPGVDKSDSCHQEKNNIVPPDCKPEALTNRNCYRHDEKNGSKR